MTELNFIQKVIFSERINHPEPIIIKDDTFKVNTDTRLDDPNIKDVDKPLCIGGFDDSTFCKECDFREDCEIYHEDLEDQKKERVSSFEVKKEVRP